jgi:hypothetical protein
MSSQDSLTDLTIPAAIWPRSLLSREQNRNEYQETSWGEGQPMLMGNNLTAICEPIVEKMWELRHITTLLTFTDCYRNIFTSLIFKKHVHFIGQIF